MIEWQRSLNLVTLRRQATECDSTSERTRLQFQDGKTVFQLCVREPFTSKIFKLERQLISTLEMSKLALDIMYVWKSPSHLWCILLARVKCSYFYVCIHVWSVCVAIWMRWATFVFSIMQELNAKGNSLTHAQRMISLVIFFIFIPMWTMCHFLCKRKGFSTVPPWNEMQSAVSICFLLNTCRNVQLQRLNIYWFNALLLHLPLIDPFGTGDKQE